MKRFILTGTPGCGKTSIIRALEMKGHLVVSEAATDVIAYEQVQGNVEPWKHPNFIDEIIQLQKQRQVQIEKVLSGLQFYDRSPICTYALATYLGFIPSVALIDNPQIGMPKTIILKQTATETNKFDTAKSETEIEKLSRFAHDWAGIEFLTEIGSDHAPRFYAGSLVHHRI